MAVTALTVAKWYVIALVVALLLVGWYEHGWLGGH